ncbi:Cold shock domain-containing protein E1 [Galemys pyrenaicus]|uniref:Cold shock domain-containing protein E1 n=1 Tax=Galemys pyrenaicus TaxID=202257 RepID=A0A8J6AB07_GALPY|nr:Cold shock domain-containing protein E1 [Galemys pyrenaicus]
MLAHEGHDPLLSLPHITPARQSLMLPAAPPSQPPFLFTRSVKATGECVKDQFVFINYEVGDSKKLFFHVKEVQDGIELQAGDEVEFSVLLNQLTGKCSACNVWWVREGPKAVTAPRPDRLINHLKNITLDDASAPRLMVLCQPRGPDNSMGFGAERKIHQAGAIA